MTESFAWLADGLNRLHREGLIRERRCVTRLPNGWCLVDGERLRDFASNDYLNLAGDPRVVEAAKAALDSAGAGARASALIVGRTDWHQRLEDTLARFEDRPAAILFPAGYAANVGTITALAGPDDVLFSDRLNHASLIDGCRLSKAQRRIFGHGDLEELERGLMESSAARRRWIVTESVFSMDGDIASLGPMCELAETYDALMVVDEAHATGIYGNLGRGIAELQGVEQRVAVRLGTLSKAIGATGGFVTGPDALIDWLWNRARTAMFSTALPPSSCAAACAAIEIIEHEPQRRIGLLARCAGFHARIAERGVPTPSNVSGPIVPIILNSPDRALAAAARLQARGFLVGVVRPPTVPVNSSRLRITLTAAHTAEDLEQLADALVETLA